MVRQRCKFGKHRAHSIHRTVVLLGKLLGSLSINSLTGKEEGAGGVPSGNM